MNKRFFTILSLIVVGCFALQAQSLDSLFVDKLAKEQLSDTTQQQLFDYYFFQGVKYTHQNQLDSAFDAFQRCRKIDSKNAAVYFEISKILQFKKESAHAFIYLQTAIDLAPNNTQYREVYLAFLVSQKHFDEAIDGYVKLAKQKPSNETYLYNLYELYGATKQPKKQIKILDQLEKLNGVTEEVIFEKLGLLFQVRNTKRAEKEIQKLIEKFPRESAYVILLGDFYREMGREKKGLACYQSILQNDSTDGYGLTAMASYYTDKNQPEQANKLMLKALNDKRLPLDNKIKWIRSYIIDLVQIQEDKGISDLFATLFSLYPDDEELLKLHIDYLIHKRDISSAITQQRRLLEINPTDEEYWHILLSLESEPYNPTKVLQVSDEALEHFPLSPNWYYQKTNAQITLNLLDEALVTIDSALTFVESIDKRIKGMFLALKAEVFIRQKKYKSAFLHFDQALEFDPANPAAQNNYAYYLALTNSDLRKAERLISEAVKVDPKNATYLDTYAWVLFMRQDYRSAKFYQERAIELETDSIILEHYGDILFALGDVDGAVKWWKKSYDSGNESAILKQKIEQKQYIPELIVLEDDETN
ncbi:MAG TPA: hypothetical protein PLJ40_03965 [Paludibacteraceae bacterium]|mgnify:FL=1|nr:hypothetical protein [Paludibacteraceae bacterium]HQB68652.1 hypothetical protein [Paludibacteraceae bacterium]HRS67514.1 hypothetical protein [Paludibacteraceae bacterium]